MPVAMSPSALLFDLDGTLIDSEQSICDAASTAFAAQGVKVDPLDVADHLGAPLLELFHIFVDDSVGMESPAYIAFRDAFIAAHDEHPNAHPELLPGVKAAFDVLQGLQLPMSVATTKPTDRAVPHVEHTALKGVLQHIQGTDPGMKAKPEPDVVLAACAALDVDPKTVWMIGDTLRDVRAAHTAGAVAVVVAYSDAQLQRAQTFGADAIVRSLEELPQLLADAAAAK